jgi:hypothetical protein
MRKPDFQSLKPRMMPRETKTITELDWNGVEQTLEIELMAMDEPRKHLAVDLMQDLLEMFVGDPDNGIKPARPPLLVKGERGQATKVVWSRQLATSVARNFTQQTGREARDRITCEELAISSINWTRGWLALNAWSAKLQSDSNKLLEKEDKDKPGNDSGEDTEGSSAPPSSASNPTPQ